MPECTAGAWTIGECRVRVVIDGAVDTTEGAALVAMSRTTPKIRSAVVSVLQAVGEPRRLVDEDVPTPSEDSSGAAAAGSAAETDAAPGPPTEPTCSGARPAERTMAARVEAAKAWGMEDAHQLSGLPRSPTVLPKLSGLRSRV